MQEAMEKQFAEKMRKMQEALKAAEAEKQAAKKEAAKHRCALVYGAISKTRMGHRLTEIPPAFSFRTRQCLSVLTTPLLQSLWFKNSRELNLC